MNLKQLLKTVLSVGLFIIFSPFILIILFATSLIWLPLVLLFSTPLAVTYLILQKTPLGSQAKVFYAKDIKEKIEASGGLQYFLLENLNNILCLVFPKLQRKATNYGYAVLNQDGKFISDFKVEFEDERLPLQLYHYLATSFERYRNLGKWNVLELESEMGGGLEYITNNLKARRAVGLSSDTRKTKYCQQTYCDNSKLEFYEAEMDKLLEFNVLKGQKFDLIISVEGRSRFGFQRFQDYVKIAENLLRPGGVFVCSDYGTVSEMQQITSELENSTLKMEKKENWTVNILHGFKLDRRRKQSLRNISLYEVVRTAYQKLHSRERKRLEVAFREDESQYWAFLLRKTA